MPHSQTIRRARSVACSRSFCAPVVVSFSISFSAAYPPIAMVILSWSHPLLREYASSSGSENATPSARPWGMMVILWRGSAFFRK